MSRTPRHRGTVGQHGLRYRFNFLAGTPYFGYDDEGEQYIAGWYVAEPRWDEANLTAKQFAEVDAEVSRFLDDRTDTDPLWARWYILEWEGIEHTHRQGKPILDYRPAYGYECAMCKSYIVAKDPGDVPFHGGPLNGRWLILPKPLPPVWRVPLPAQISAAAYSDAVDALSMQVVEYRRGPGGYYIDRQTLPVTPSTATELA